MDRDKGPGTGRPWETIMRIRMIRRALACTTVIAVAGFALPSGAIAADVLVAVGQNATEHYEVARAICRHVQRTGGALTCEALRIEGRDAAEPIAVLSDVRTGAIEVGLVTSDWQHHAFEGSGPVEFMDVKFDNIRSLFSLHSEAFTVVARRDAAIETLDDLVGKRVNIGNPGSGQRAIMEMVMKAKGWTRDSFQLADELTESEQSLALCHARVQAMVLTVAHPNAALARTMELCDAIIVAAAGGEIEKLVGENRFMAMTEVPADAYPGSASAVSTFGVTVTAVSSSDIDEELAYAVTKSVFDGLDRLKRLHPALGNLRPDRMAMDGVSAPPHPGALRYFREQGLM